MHKLSPVMQEIGAEIRSPYWKILVPLPRCDIINPYRTPEYCGSRSLLPLNHKFLVVSLLAARLRLLDLAILLLESAGLTFSCHSLFHEGLHPVLLVDSGTVELCWAFNYCARLRKRWNFAFSIAFLVMSMWVEDRPHFDELEITLELRSQIRLWQVKPLGTGRELIVLISSV